MDHRVNFTGDFAMNLMKIYRPIDYYLDNLYKKKSMKQTRKDEINQEES